MTRIFQKVKLKNREIINLSHIIKKLTQQAKNTIIFDTFLYDTNFIDSQIK